MTASTVTSAPVTAPLSGRRAEFLSGARATLPLLLGAIPFGIIFGAVAVGDEVGLSPAATLGMSAFVFAGSAQFIAANLIGQGAALGLIVLTTFIVNLRHGLYSASLAPFMKHLPQRWLLPLGFWLTDESYAVVIRRYTDPDDSPYKHWFFFGSALAMYTNWQLCTLIGILAGQNDALADLGLDFALVVTFIAIVVPLLTTRPMLLAAATAALASIVFNDLPNNLGLMVASLLGIVAGYLAESSQASAAARETRLRERGLGDE